MAGDTTLFHAFGHAPGQRHTFGVFQDIAIGRILDPKPVFVCTVVPFFPPEHDGDCLQVFVWVVGHFFYSNILTIVVAFHDYCSPRAIDLDRAFDGIQYRTMGWGALVGFGDDGVVRPSSCGYCRKRNLCPWVQKNQ